MYTIYAKFPGAEDYVPIHHPILEYAGKICVNPKLDERINSHGCLEFTIYPTNPEFGKIVQRGTYIIVYEDSNEIWRGRAISTSRDINNAKSVFCEGELSYLCDSVQRPMIYSGTVSNLLQMLLTEHNTQHEGDAEKIFQLGEVTVGVDAENNRESLIEVELKTAQTTWSAIQNMLVKQFAGYLRTRKEEGVVYLDYLDDFTEETNQKIQFGKNMLKFVEKTDASDVITVLEPYGAQKNTPPILYKRRSSSSLKFDKITDISQLTSGGQYLIVSNGGALKTTYASDSNHTKLWCDILEFDVATVTEDKIEFLSDDAVDSVTIWTITRATTPGTDVNVSSSGSLSKSINLTVNGSSYGSVTESTSASGGSVSSSASSSGVGASISVYDDNNNYIGKTGNVSLSGSGIGTISTTAKTATTANDCWSIRTGTTYLKGTGIANQLVVVTKSSPSSITKQECWQISIDDSGAKIVNKYNSDMDVPATIHGDVDRGWSCCDSANGDDYIPPLNSRWDGNRVNLKRDSVYYITDGRIALDDPSIINIYGFVYGTKIFDSITTSFELRSFAENYVHQSALAKFSLSVNAVDLSFSSVNIDSISVGTYSVVISKPLDFNKKMLCVQKTTWLMQPDKTVIVLGVGQQTLTDIQGGLTADVRYS